MNTNSLLSQDQHDALSEIVNIGMGRAGEQLAKVLETFVELSIPKIATTDQDEIKPTITRLIDSEREYVCTRQAFFGHWRGEAMTLFYQDTNEQLATLMGYQGDRNADLETELKLDISNILVGACMNGIAHTLDFKLKFGPPSLVSKRTYADNIFDTSKFNWQNVLFIEVSFALENLDFRAHLLIVMEDSGIDILRKDLDSFLDNL
ncbi:MAG: hypothetical protein OEZ43_17030 [Gammaproteobacteria bacterium]|nr:hypothetical protein [Gammaproteobacteria bacterium]